MRVQSMYQQTIRFRKENKNIFSPLVSASRSMAKPLLSSLSKLTSGGAFFTNKKASFDLNIDLTDKVIDRLNKKTSVYGIINRTFCAPIDRVEVSNMMEKELVANALKEAVVNSIGCNNLNLERFTALASEIANNEMKGCFSQLKSKVKSEKKINKYIKKTAPYFMDLMKSNALKDVLGNIREEVRSIKNGNNPIELTSENVFNEVYRAKENKNIVKLNRTLFDEIAKNEFLAIPFKTKENDELLISGPYLQKKGLDWVKEHLPNLLEKLEKNIQTSLERAYHLWDFGKGNYFDTKKKIDIAMDWDEFIQKQGVVKRLIENIECTEIGRHFPLFVEQLIQCKLENKNNYSIFHELDNKEVVKFSDPRFKDKGLPWRKNIFPTEVRNLESEISSRIGDLQKSFFEKNSSILNKNMIHKGLFEIHGDLKEKNDFAKEYPEIFNMLFSKIEESILINQVPLQFIGDRFQGAYLKKGTNIGTPTSATTEKTRVKTANGRVYELLNTLTKNDNTDIMYQHNLNMQGAVVLGEGGFGKVRLAREIQTGSIVAVKKFSIEKKGNPTKEATEEIKQFDRLAKKISHLPTLEGSSSLATMLDYAHVAVPKKGSLEKVPKSYIFSPLANGGDGKDAISELSMMSKDDPEAKARFIHISKGYTKAVMEMHRLNRAHRDIKPGNFLHTKATESTPESVKLADFGMLARCSSDEKTKPTGFVGTNGYLPPEAKENTTGYNPKAHDNFSLGVTLLKLKNAISFYYNKNSIQLRFTDKTKKDIVLKTDGITTGNENYVGVDMLAYKANRYNLDMKHPDNIIALLLNKDIDNRISATEAFQFFEKL